MNDTITSYIRTLVPIIAGYIITLASTVGVEIQEGDLNAVLVPIVMGAWYAIGRFVEARVPQDSPWRFLAVPFIGIPKASGPSYAAAA